MKHQSSQKLSVDRALARVHRLARRGQRDAQGCFWIEGVRQFVQAYDAKFFFESVIFSPILLKSRLAEMLIRRLGGAAVERVRISPEQFRSISKAERASGIGAIVRQRWMPLHSAQPKQGLCWLVIDELRSPGNLGTILRTAEAVGAAGVIFVGTQCDPFDPNVLRASMGGIFHLSLVRANCEQLRAWVQRHHVQLIGLSPTAERLWTELPSRCAVALALGEERTGLSPRLQSLCEHTVRLPMTGKADSLNVAISAGVMLYELVRTRQPA